MRDIVDAVRAASKSRVLLLAVLAALALAGLTACRTNVGYAATIDGKRYTESDVGDYLTPDARPVERQDDSGATSQYPVRAFVLETLIGEALLEKVASRLPGGGPTPAQLRQLRSTVLQGKSVERTVTEGGIRGFTRAFDDLLVRRVTLAQYLQSAAQQGVPVQQVLTSTPFEVSVNPRYGVWNAKDKVFDGSDGAGAPSFLDIKTFTPLGNAANGGASPSTPSAPR